MNTATVLSFGKERVEPTAAMERYEHVYRVAEQTIDFGETVRLAGIFLGGVLIIAGIIAYQMNRAEQSGFPGVSLVLGACAIAVVLVAHVLDRYFRAQGHLLEMGTDGAVHSSPFLTNAQRTEVMGMPPEILAEAVDKVAA
jgi:hypothetical protein